MTLSMRRTRTASDEQKGGTLEAPDVVRSLLLYGTDTEYPLPARFKSITVGADPKNQISISNDLVSRAHCQLTRRWKQLRVRDKASKNGTWYEGVKETSFDLAPGKTFIVGGPPNRLLALNEVMRQAYPDLRDILGAPDEHVVRSDTPSPSDMIVTAVDGGHLLLTSDPSCGQERLAELIHSMSRRRSRPAVIVDDVRAPTTLTLRTLQQEARRSTVTFDLGNDETRIAPAIAAALFSSSQSTRVIVLARSVGVALAALGADTLMKLQRVYLRPIATRHQAVPRLLDRFLKERGSPLRFSHMTTHNQQALRAHNWPENFASLREAADRLAAVARTGSANQAAAALKIPPSTFYYWFSGTVGLRGRLISDD